MGGRGSFTQIFDFLIFRKLNFIKVRLYPLRDISEVSAIYLFVISKKIKDKIFLDLLNPKLSLNINSICLNIRVLRNPKNMQLH